MDVDVFKDILVPVIGGLGIFLLGLEFMDRGIQALSVNKMRQWLAKMAGSPAKGVMAGTIITGIIQSSTAMTVMTVGLVNAGVLSLRGAIGVVMGANIGTTLGNGLIALPLGPIGLLFSGIFAVIYVFGKTEKLRNIALAAMGFSLIFYGLNLMTGGLKPLREMPQVMAVLSNLDASTFFGVLTCALIAALVTAMIHSSSATIGIVMGLGASGVLEWKTAIAFAIGADLGTTITSWIASLNLSKNAKRTAYAHIAFNFIGVSVVLALFFPAIQVLTWVMGFFGGDPGVPVVIDGNETFPLVPVAVGLFSIFFNIFNVLILFPFVNVFERVLSRIGHTEDEDLEDYSLPKYLDRKIIGDYSAAVPAMRNEIARTLEGSTRFLDIARGQKNAPDDPADHYDSMDSLSREIRSYAAAVLDRPLEREQVALVADMIEEIDFAGSLNETLAQIARRMKRDEFSPAGRAILDVGLGRLDRRLEHLVEVPSPEAPAERLVTDGEAELLVAETPEVNGDGVAAADRVAGADVPLNFEGLRREIIDTPGVEPGEKGALFALLGSLERAESLMDRIEQQRGTVDRDVDQVIGAVSR
ncbi:Na/Pi cotransporter family protein [Millisia brevis]|uniref:Na/Pi cotransporter family protein n=1 Tax=Millisia brevis TaxID=264148 RepID=UPI0008298AC9|nr:Na/Pi symporter [Millisia brevis]